MAFLNAPLRRTAPATASPGAPGDCGAELAVLSHRLARVTGRDFIEEFARATAEACGADVFLIGRLNAYSNVMRSICLIEDGVVAPNITYSLDGTPCARAVDSDTCVYNGDVAAQFPLDKQLVDMRITAYVGTPLRTKDDQPLGIIVALSRIPFARPGAVSAIFNHFRDRISREVETLETLERYRLATDDGEVGIWDWDITTGEMFLSKSISKMLGHDEDGCVYDLSLIDSAIHEDDLPIKNAALAAHMKDDSPFDIVVRLRNKRGGYRWYRLRANALRNESGLAVRMVGSVRDVHALIGRYVAAGD